MALLSPACFIVFCLNTLLLPPVKLVEKIRVPKKSGPEAVAIQDPVTNEMKTSKKEIIECTVGYCTKLLTNNKPDEEYTKDITIKKQTS